MTNISDFVKRLEDFIRPRAQEESILRMEVGKAYRVNMPIFEMMDYMGILERIDPVEKSVILKEGVTETICAAGAWMGWSGGASTKETYKAFDTVSIPFSRIVSTWEINQENIPWDKIKE